MIDMAYHRCPICDQENLVEMDQSLIRFTDDTVCENERFIHIRRGHIEIIVHTELSLSEEPKLVAHDF